MITCSKCKTEVHPLAVFPADLCVDCYALTPEANAPLTAQDIKQMFIRSVNI